MNPIWIILGLLALSNKKKDESESLPLSVDESTAPLKLPEKGTGLETGRAGERRAGKPRTESERKERHYA